MLKTIAVLGGDARQCYLAERLMAGGFCVEPYQVPGLPDSRTGLHAALSRAHAAALPMPALTKENWIRAEPRPIPLVSVLESLSPGTLVFGGPFEAAAETFAQYPVVLSDYTRSPALAAGNAVPTAEGAIQLAMERLPITLSGSRCLVVGFGRIGKALAARLRAAGNISFDGIQCHISGSRSIAGWESRARVMLALARELFPDAPPKFIDLGSGMFGRLPEEMRASFGQNIPTFAEYGAAVGTLFRAQYGAMPVSERPALITEPGTTLVADTMQFAAPVTAIKSLPGNDCAVLDASIHTAGVISQMRNLPLLVLDAKTPRENLNFTGYTCLEYDILYRGYTGPLDVGSSVIFDNIGSYSNVLKPPFIHPDVPMIEYRKGDDSLRLIKRAQTAEEIFAQYVFEE